MKVTTLNHERFAEACSRLEAAAAGFNPDVVVGIATGGVYVAEQMFVSVKHVTVRCRRSSSGTKDKASGFFAVVRKMPLWMRNGLRRLEARLLKRHSASTAVEISDDVVGVLANSDRILIVDDAVDSGKTLKAVSDIIRNLVSTRNIAAAAIVVTTEAPLQRPDFTLYDKGTLVRFPWSKDFNEND